MAETSGLVVQDVSSFGVSDTGLTQFRTPDPLALSIPDRDLPFTPRPLEELYLAPYLSTFDLRYDVIPEERGFGVFGAPRFSYQPTDQWYYERTGTLTTQEQVRARNAEVVAAYLVDQRTDLVQHAIDAGAVSRATVEQGVLRAPVLAVEKSNALQWARFRKLEADAADQAGFAGSQLGQFLIGSTTLALSIAFPPAAPFLAAGYGAYVLATTIPEQVETGQVKVGTVINQALAAAAVVGGVSSGVSSFSATPSVGAVSAPPTGKFLTPAPRGPITLTSASIAQPIAGESALVSGLFNLPTAPALTQASRLGLSASSLLSGELSTLSRVTSFVRQNPGKTVAAGETGVRVIDRILDGDWAGLANLVLGASGVPVQVRPDVPTPPQQISVPRPPVGGGQGGGSMLFSGPADPASSNVWPWVFGALLLGVFLFAVGKGK